MGRFDVANALPRVLTAIDIHRPRPREAPRHDVAGIAVEEAGIMCRVAPASSRAACAVKCRLRGNSAQARDAETRANG